MMEATAVRADYFEPHELEYFDEIERRVSLESSPVSEVIELGRLYSRSPGEGEKALRVFEAAVRREPTNEAAAFCVANECYLALLMNDVVARDEWDRVERILRHVVAKDGEYAGAALTLLSRLMEDESRFPVEERIAVLSASIEKEPNWVHNRDSLASLLEAAGRIPEAIKHRERAIANWIGRDPSWGITRTDFEDEITGRACAYTLEQCRLQLSELRKRAGQSR